PPVNHSGLTRGGHERACNSTRRAAEERCLRGRGACWPRRAAGLGRFRARLSGDRRNLRLGGPARYAGRAQLGAGR
ncbi:MAG TPA: hypothetical protein DCM66_11140, partial [Erythrobacter sp.]|nr:hypothetical protein [Erythrobacter sp.]